MTRCESRKRAYHYIITQATKVNLDLSHISDKAVADANNISLNDSIFTKPLLKRETDRKKLN